MEPGLTTRKIMEVTSPAVQVHGDSIISVVTEFVLDTSRLGPFGIIKGMLWWWRLRNQAKPEEDRAMARDPNLPDRFRDCLRFLIPYDPVNTRVLDYCVPNLGRFSPEMCRDLGETRNTALLQWAEARCAQEDPDYLDSFIRNTRIGGIQLYRPTSEYDLCRAARKTTKKLKPKLQRRVQKAAIRDGRILDMNKRVLDITDRHMLLGKGEEIIATLMANPFKYVLTSHSADHVAALGNLSMLVILYVMGAKRSQAGIDYAAGRGHLDVMLWLYEMEGMEPTDFGLQLAVAASHTIVAGMLWNIQGKK